MALPRKLKHFNLFNDGESYLGQVNEITLPKLSRKMEDYLGGGMSGPVKVDHGQEGIELEWKCGGMMRSVLNQYGVVTADGVQLRFAGAYQEDDDGTVACAVGAVKLLQVQRAGKGPMSAQEFLRGARLSAGSKL